MKNENCLLYYKVLKTLFPSSSFRESKFLLDVKKQLIEYSRLHPDCSYEDVTLFFGKPEDILCDYIGDSGSIDLYYQIHKKKLLHTLCGGIFAVVLAAGIFYCILWYKMYCEFIYEMPSFEEITIDPGEVSEDPVTAPDEVSENND